MLSEAWTDRGLVDNAIGRIFNNTLYARYLQFTKDQTYSYETNLSSERILHKENNRKGSVKDNLLSTATRGLGQG
jgi:hypothetical protein